MSDTPERELASAIVHDAAHRYIESRRARLDDFVDRHFTFSGALALHRRALGWDLLRAPANLFLAGPALALKLMAWAARRGRMDPTALWLARRRLLLETDVAREIEWLVATELFEIPYRRRNRVFRLQLFLRPEFPGRQAPPNIPSAQLDRLHSRAHNEVSAMVGGF